jgi:hypothetical protein
MPAVHVTSSQTPEQVIRSIMTLCPGGPVGTVMAKRGKLLLPRHMTIKRVAIDRRAQGLPMGRIIVSIARTESGTALTINAGGHPAALAVSVALVAALVAIAAFAVGGVAAAVFGVGLAVFEAVRWRKGLSAAAADGEWLAAQLRSGPTT